MDIGVAVIDCFTHYILQYLETLTKSSKATLQDFVWPFKLKLTELIPWYFKQFATYDPARIHSHPGISTELSRTSPEEILVTDFFGGVASVEVLGREGILPVLGRKVGRWEDVGRGNRLGSGSLDAGWHMGSLNHTARAISAGEGWKRPLMEEEGSFGFLRGMAGLATLGLVSYSFLRDGVKRKVD